MSQPGSKISSGVSHREQPNKAYMSTRAFNGALYTYTVTMNSSLQKVGTLALNASATTANSPAGRVVHANGKVLIPGVHVGGGTATPNTLANPMIGVYDPVTGLNGYINPQDSTWAVYDATLPAFYDNTANPSSTLGGQGAEPRFGAANIAVAASTSTAGVATVDIGAAHVGTIAPGDTSTTTLTVTSSEVTTNSIILLTYRGGTATVIVRVSAQSNGSFSIVTPAAFGATTDRIHFMIIN